MMLYIGLLSFILLVVLFQGYRFTEAFAQYASDQARIAAETAKFKPGGEAYVAPTTGSGNAYGGYSVKCSTGEVTLNGTVVDNRFTPGIKQSQFEINSTIPPNGKILDSNERIIGNVPEACSDYTWNGKVWGPTGTTSTKSSGGSGSETGTGSSSDLASRAAEAIAITDLSTFTLKNTTTVTEIKKILDALNTRIKSITSALTDLPNTVTDINMSENQITTFGYSKVKDPSDSTKKLIKISGTATPVVYLTIANAKDTFLANIKFHSDSLKTNTDILNKLITDKTIVLTDTLTVAANKVYPGNTSWLDASIKTTNTNLAKAILQYAFYDSFINKNKVIKYETSSESSTSETETVSGSETGTGSTSTIWAAIGPLGSITNATEAANDEDTVSKSRPAPADPSSSPLFTKEIEERLVKDILTQLKDQKIMDRSVEQPLDQEDDSEGRHCSSNATSQGREWRRNKPDMSQYIRKDSIPCWNCSP